MAKRSYEIPQRSVPKLKVSPHEAKLKITEQIERGTKILRSPFHNEEAFASAKATRQLWVSYVSQLLLSLFDGDSICSEFHGLSVFVRGDLLPDEEIEEFKQDVGAYILSLQSIYERVDLFEQVAERAAFQTAPSVSSKKVFIVHGHDNAAKESVARALVQLGLEAIILHEQANRGRTIIEKFENYSDVAFAVVILTADDEGMVKGATPRSRARQNVILELGFFVGRLGRNKVCPLYQMGVELPSDLAGVVYTELDAAGAWRFMLAKELKAAGLGVDLNKL